MLDGISQVGRASYIPKVGYNRLCLYVLWMAPSVGRKIGEVMTWYGIAVAILVIILLSLLNAYIWSKILEEIRS